MFQRLNEEKAEVERTLMNKFVAVLNAKKAKIKAQREELQALRSARPLVAAVGATQEEAREETILTQNQIATGESAAASLVGRPCCIPTSSLAGRCPPFLLPRHVGTIPRL